MRTEQPWDQEIQRTEASWRQFTQQVSPHTHTPTIARSQSGRRAVGVVPSVASGARWPGHERCRCEQLHLLLQLQDPTPPSPLTRAEPRNGSPISKGSTQPPSLYSFPTAAFAKGWVLETTEMPPLTVLEATFQLKTVSKPPSSCLRLAPNSQ